MDERRQSHLDLYQRMTAQETLMAGVREDVSEIKEHLLGNGKPGLTQRIDSLESTRRILRSWGKAVGWAIATGLTALGAWAALR